MAAYWTTCFEPWWPRMRAVLEADIVFRGRVIAREGLAAMFADLSPRIRLVDDVLRVEMSSKVGFRRSTAGEGLTLTPTLFTRNATAPISPDEAPCILYGARGAGTLWESDRPGRAARPGRPDRRRPGPAARRVLESPASSTELAIRLGVTTSAVNQHLRAMRDAGLLTLRAARSLGALPALRPRRPRSRGRLTGQPFLPRPCISPTTWASCLSALAVRSKVVRLSIGLNLCRAIALA